MVKPKNKKFSIPGYYFVLAAFVVAFGFFMFAYPYHLVRREQQTLFLYDIPYILKTYRGSGFLSRFVGDFAEQFFCIKAVGAVIVSALLAAIGTLVYNICRNFTGKKLSLFIAFLFWGWSLLRETDTLYITQYTIAVAGYLLCIFAALKFKNIFVRAGSLLVFLALGVWLFGTPYNKYYGKWIGKPDFDQEKMLALDAETFNENWDKVLELSQANLMYNEACYMYNLATAMKGCLSENLMKHPQNEAEGLFYLVTSDLSPFSNGIAGEVWYHLGLITLADQSVMVAMQSSPKHNGARFIKRLAMINIISEEYGAAEKYLTMLQKTLFYHGWAEKMMSGGDEQTQAMLAKYRSNLVKTDIVSRSNDYRTLLHLLLEANPDNRMAREYLLCYDLLSLDLDAFMEDYVPEEYNPSLYQEAVLIWINVEHRKGNIKSVNMDQYGIKPETIEKLQKFYRYPDQFKSTYWYYAMD